MQSEKNLIGKNVIFAYQNALNVFHEALITISEDYLRKSH